MIFTFPHVVNDNWVDIDFSSRQSSWDSLHETIFYNSGKKRIEDIKNKIFYLKMETIHIPQVNLVNASGQKIGVYTEDPNWWIKLQLRRRNQVLPQTQNSDAENTPVSAVGSVSSEKKLIDEQQQKIQIQMKVINALRSDHEMPEGDDINDRHNVIGETPLHIGVFLLINIFFSNLK